MTVSLEDLVARSNAATVFGSGEAGTLIGPETARRIACDAGIVPVVLGKDGQILDVGRRFRLFTSAQLRALWLRDGGCTFPDCTVPASWCEGHHLRHWADGGSTDLGNAALLCGRHHTIVHRKGYLGELVDGHVRWVLVPGSYDHWLADQAGSSLRPGFEPLEPGRRSGPTTCGESSRLPPPPHLPPHLGDHDPAPQPAALGGHLGLPARGSAVRAGAADGAAVLDAPWSHSASSSAPPRARNPQRRRGMRHVREGLLSLRC